MITPFEYSKKNYRCWFYIVIIFLFMKVTFASSQVPDSLIHNREHATNDTMLVNALNAISRYYVFSSGYDSAKIYADRAIELSTKINWPKGMADGYLRLGIKSNFEGNQDSAKAYYLKALEIYEKINSATGKSSCYNNIGIIYFNQTNYPLAIEYWYKSLKINEILNDKMGLANIYVNIGNAFGLLDDDEKSLEYKLLALKIRNETGEKSSNTVNTLDAVGNIYMNRKQYNLALPYYRQSLSLSRDLNDSYSLTTSYLALSSLFLQMYQENDSVVLNSQQEIYPGIKLTEFRKLLLDSSSALAKTAIIISSTGQNIRKKLESLIGFAAVLIETGKHKEAINYLLQANNLIEQNDDYDITNEIALYLKNAYAAVGNYKEAYYWSNIHINWLKNNNNYKNKNIILSQQIKHDYEKQKAQEQARQEKKEALAIAELQKLKTQKYTFVIVTALLLLLAIVLFRLYRLKQKSNSAISKAFIDLKKAQEQLVQQEKLASLGALTAGIAHEISNPLNFVNNFSELAEELIGDLQESKSDDDKTKTLAMLKSNLAKINFHGKRADAIIKNMLEHSHTGEHKKHLTNLNKLCDEFATLSFQSAKANYPDFKCEFTRSFDDSIPEMEVAYQEISRVILNLLNNAFYAIKNKKDACVSLTTKFAGNQVMIAVRDNGNGIPGEIKNKIFQPFFTTKPPGEGTGLGLSLSYDIIKAHGGEIKLDTKENEYTEFTILLPV